jgi:hypothetical protein
MNLNKLLGFLWLMVFLIPLVWLPILFNGSGVYDWDHVLQRYAAIYQTHFKYDQLPGNNIWAGGGMPLGQTVSGYGLFTALTMFTGPYIGIHLGVAIYYTLGYFGSLKLASVFTKDIPGQVYFSLYFVFGNAISYHLSVGHIGFSNIFTLPYILYLAINYQNYYSGILCGLLFGLANLDGLTYTNQYIAIVLMVFLIWRFIADINSPAKIISFTIFLALGFLSVTASKLITIYPLWKDFPRMISGVTNYAWTDWIRFSFLPYTGLDNVNVGSNLCSGKWENGNYLGLSALILLLLAVFNRKKPNILIPVLLILVCSYSNDTNWYSFNYYLKMLPSFASHLCTTRLRMLSPIVVGLVILLAYKNERTINFFGYKILKNKVLLFVVFEIFTASSLNLIDSHNYDKEKSPIIWSSEFRSYSKLPVAVSDLYSATMSNIGVTSETESYIAYSPGKDSALSKVLSRSAEFTQGEAQIIPTYWSPNKIVFITKDLDNCISTKIHISNLWNINGVNIYQNKRVYESSELICEFPDQAGRLELEYKLPSTSFGIPINLVIMLITLFILIIVRRLKNEEFKIKKTVAGFHLD